MKKIGLLHGELSKVLAEMAHDDLLLIGDAGMPCPKGVPFIDLAVTQGVPSFLQVLEGVLSELKVAEAYMDIEQAETSPQFNQSFLATINNAFPLREIPHQQLKDLSQTAKAMIRTGEFTPYANILLKADVLF